MSISSEEQMAAVQCWIEDNIELFVDSEEESDTVSEGPSPGEPMERPSTNPSCNLQSKRVEPSMKGPQRVDHMLRGSDDRFVDLFRISKPTFNRLCSDLFQRGMKDERSISQPEKVMYCLLVTGRAWTQREVQCFFSRSAPSVSSYTNEVLLALRRLSSSYIKLPEMGAGWQNPLSFTSPDLCAFFKGAIGVLENVQIVACHANGQKKRRAALVPNVLVAVDWNGNVIWFSKSYDGSIDDGWRAAKASGFVLPPNFYLLGDSNFPADSRILKPYADVEYGGNLQNGTGSPTNEKELFNLHHHRARSAAEKTIRLLKHRFNILTSMLEYEADTQEALVEGCLVLHNYIKRWQNSPDAIERSLTEAQGSSNQSVVAADSSRNDRDSSGGNQQDPESMATRQQLIAAKMWADAQLAKIEPKCPQGTASRQLQSAAASMSRVGH